MAQMSRLRQIVGRYKLVKITNYKDISYMSQYEIDKGWGIPMSFWYYSNGHKTVRKDVDGHWNIEQINKESKQ